jgi:hypothetical protein
MGGIVQVFFAEGHDIPALPIFYIGGNGYMGVE